MSIKNLADLRAVEAPPWIWKGMLLPSGLTLLSAAPKVGKTTFLFHLLRAMWSQDEYMGLEIRPAPTLVISEEADTLIATRCDALGFSEMWPIGWLTPEPGRQWKHILVEIKQYATMYHNPLIVIDTLSRHWGIDDENDNAKVESVLNPLIAITRRTGASVLLIHHTRKSGGTGGMASRGGSAIVGAVDIILELTRYERGDKTNKRRLEAYSRYAETPGMDDSLIIQLSEEGYVLKDEHGDPSQDKGSERAVRKFLLAEGGWWQQSAIAATLGIPVRTVGDALNLLVTIEESVNVKGTGRKNSPYLYSATEDVEELGG